MLFKNRKEAQALRAKEIELAHVQIENQFYAAMEAAGRMTDPAEKVIALSKVAKLISGEVTASRRDKTLQKEFKEIAAGHIERMRDQAVLNAKMTVAVVDEHVDEISKSPLCRQILALPGIADVFSDAAVKHIVAAKALAAKEALAPAAEAAPPAEVKKPAAEQKPKTKQTFDKITKAIEP